MEFLGRIGLGLVFGCMSPVDMIFNCVCVCGCGTADVGRPGFHRLLRAYQRRWRRHAAASLSQAAGSSRQT